MKRELKIVSILMTLCFIVSCSSGGSDDGPSTPPPPPPNSDPTAVSQLIYPSADLLCIDNTITFQWSAASDPDGDPISYILVIAEDRNFTNVAEQITVSTTNVTINLQQGKAYYWKVTAIDNKDGQSQPSSTFAFFTEGNGVSNNAPFTAALNAPTNESSVIVGIVNLSWTGGDSDVGDTLIYDLYFGETADPASLEMALSENNFDVTVNTGLTYYWKVDTIDDSGVKTIGQIWTFTVN